MEKGKSVKKAKPVEAPAVAEKPRKRDVILVVTRNVAVDDRSKYPHANAQGIIPKDTIIHNPSKDERELTKCGFAKET